MKYLILALLFFLIFWYYKKRRLSPKPKRGSLEVEMRPCSLCGVYFASSEGHSLEEGSKVLHFCSEKCLKEYQEKKQVK